MTDPIIVNDIAFFFRPDGSVQLRAGGDGRVRITIPADDRLAVARVIAGRVTNIPQDVLDKHRERVKQVRAELGEPNEALRKFIKEAFDPDVLARLADEYMSELEGR